ncbi:MAG TPA: ATP-binding protein, partial [Puia sp.]
VEDYAILLLDRDGIIMNWNKGAQKIKGYREDEIIGKSFRVFYLPEDRQRKLPEKLIDEASRNGKATHEGWRLRKDGTRFWGSIVITSLHDDQHNIIGFTKVTRDLTEFKIASDQIKDYARELEFQNKELQQFAYAAAHDLKEPLRKVQFYNSAILENAGEALPDRERTFLNNSINSVKRMKGLIDDLLKYAKVSEYLEKFEDVDIKTIVEEIMVFYRDLSGDDIIRAELNALPVISGIPFQIRQLFENLLGNAFKYHHRDRKPVIQITCEKEFHTFVTESDTDSTAPYYKITVQDNGIGFEPEFAQKIFELFHRLHPREEYSGTGVGLAICKRIVQNHKGFIEAASLPDQGSAFTIYLPCS